MAAIIPAIALGAAVGAELPRFFNDALDQFGSGEGVYLRDGEPTGIVATVGQAVGRAYCRAYAGVSQEYPPGRGERIERACRPYLDSLDPGTGPGLELPFRGGQCAGAYIADYEVRDRISAEIRCAVFSEWRQVTGAPLLGTGSPRGPLSGGTEVITVTSSPPGTNRTQRFPVFAANGLFHVNLGGSPARQFWAACGPAYEIRNLRFRLSAGGQECGNPTPNPVPSPTIPNPQPPPFRFNPVPGVDIDIDASVELNGDITFNIGTGPITVDPFGGGGGSGGSGGTVPPGDIGQPSGGSSTGGGGESEGEAPPGNVLVGVKLAILTAPPSARRYSLDVYRAACYVYMGVPGNLDQDFGGSMLEDGQFLFAEKDNLTAWRVRANDGYNIGVTPYYREIE